MRGSRAKRLREGAAAICSGQGTKLSEGYRIYNQAMNSMQMVPALDSDDMPIMVGGQPTMKPDMRPGTVTCAWVVRNIYQTLKRQWKVRARA